MNSRTLLLAATALTFAPLARADEATNANDLTAKVLAILNSPAGKEELAKQIQALAAALKANGQGDLNETVTKLLAQIQAGNGAANVDVALPELAGDGGAPVPTRQPQHSPAPTSGLQTSHLQTSSLQSSSGGLTSPEDWRKMFRQ